MLTTKVVETKRHCTSFPKLMRHKEGSCILLAMNERTGGYLGGTVVHSYNAPNNVGDFSWHWPSMMFDDFYGEVVIGNDD